MKKILIAILFVLFISEISSGEVYKWVDERGVIHFTDDVFQIPEKYRPKAEKIGESEGRSEIKGEAESLSKRKEEPYKDRLGRGEDYWKGKIEEWKKKLRDSQERVESLRVKYNELTERFNDSKSTAERGSLLRERDQIKNEMDQYKIQIEEAKNMLDRKIPEEAELYKAKPEWLKQ